MTEFFIPKIETRSSLKKGVKEFIIRGYAATAGNIYSYRTESNSDGVPVRSFKEYFTDDAIESINRKAKSEKIFVDYGHVKAGSINTKKIMNDIETRRGINLTDETEYIINMLDNSDIPMFKVEDIKIDDNGLFVDIRGNPFYRDVDEHHQKYFDAIWNSLENGFINGMSLNMKATEFVELNEGIRQIDDADIYGISLISGAANEMANITEVAMRCVEHVRGEAKCQKKMTSLMM